MSDGIAPTAHTSWAGRPWLARALRAATFVLPVVLAFFVTYSLSSRMPEPGSLGMAIAEGVLFIGIAFVVMASAERVLRLVAPVTVLLRMTMVFPDKAPSRVKVAMRVSSTEELRRILERVHRHGLGDDAGEAAETLMVLVAALSRHDRNTRGHSERVRAYADVIAGELGLTTEERSKLRWAALLHDVGKMQIPAEILNKPARLTEAEYEIVKQHPLLGAELAAPLMGFLGPWANAIAEHHERWDGGGYPYGLAGEEINYGARIVAVADTFDVITSLRSYKQPGTATAAREEIARCAGTQFDPEVVKAFLRIGLGRFPWSVAPLSMLTQVPYLTTILSPVSTGISAVAAAAAPAMVAAAIATGATVGDASADVLALRDVPQTTIDAARTTEPGSIVGSPSSTAEGAPATTTTPAGRNTTVAETTTTSLPGTPTLRSSTPTTSGPTSPPTWITSTTAPTVTTRGTAEATAAAPATTTTAPATTTTARATTTTAPATTTSPVNRAPDGPLPPIIGECVGEPGITAIDFRRITAEFFDCDLRSAGPLDLSGYNLAGSEIRGGDWTDADFTGAVLTDAHFHDARLVRVHFDGADLTKVLFDDDILVGATFRNATLTETDFVRADLSYSNFSGADFHRSQLNDAVLTGADFTSTDILDSQLKKVSAQDARFDRAKLNEVDLGESQLSGASFRNAVLYDVKIDRSVIQAVTFDGAAMTLVDLKDSVGAAILGTGPWSENRCPDDSQPASRSCSWL